MYGMLSTRVGALALFGTLMATGCGRAAARLSDVPAGSHIAGESCWVAPPPDGSGDSLLIVIHGQGSAGPGAARFDQGRRLVASLTGENRAPTDCAGKVFAGATIAWVRDSSAGERYVASSGWPAVRVATLDGAADSRDALDRGADLLITADPAAVAYARALGDRVIVPLEMRWTYGLLIAHAIGDGRSPPGLASLRVSLSREVVPAAARAAADSAAVRCTGMRGDLLAPSPRIVHRADDPVARAIAGRLVSLAAAGDATVHTLVPHDGTALVAAPLDATAFAAALAGQEDAAYVVAWQNASGASCGAVLAQLSRATAGDAVSRRTIVATALVDAGEWAIVRRGTFGLVTDSRGDLRLVPATAGFRTGAP